MPGEVSPGMRRVDSVTEVEKIHVIRKCPILAKQRTQQ